MKFVAFERSKQGTGASRRLRNSGRTPGIVYGGANSQPLMIELDHNALVQALKKEAFHASVLDMELGGSESKVLLRDVQMHPFRPLVLHVDFQRVDATTKLHMKVPLHFGGEENSPAVKFESCIANHVMTELDVLCLPSDLPEFITVDLSGLKKGRSLHLSDIKLPKGVSAVTHGQKDPVVVSVVAVAGGTEVAPTAEGEAAAPAAAAAAAPAKGGKPAAPAAKAPAAKK